MEKVTIYSICPVTLADATSMFHDLNLGDIHNIHAQPRTFYTLYIAEYSSIFDQDRIQCLRKDRIQRKNNKGYIQIFTIK